jgi:hypothetical protein
MGVIIKKVVEQGLSTLSYMEPDMWKFGYLYFEQTASHKSALLYYIILHAWLLMVGGPTKAKLRLIS